MIAMNDTLTTEQPGRMTVYDINGLQVAGSVLCFFFFFWGGGHKMWDSLFLSLGITEAAAACYRGNNGFFNKIIEIVLDSTGKNNTNTYQAANLKVLP